MTKQRQKVPDFVSSESFEWPQAAWMLPTKLSPQQQHVQEIQRPDLINSLHSGIDSAVTLIVSPAGYGKTTVLAQWREHLLREQITIAWLTLDEDDGEPLVFLSYLIVALAQAGLNLGQLELAAVNGLVETPRKLVLAAMINAITEQPARTVIMLDDYHRIQSDDVDQMLETLIANLPQNLHVVIATREPPNLELAGLRTRGQLNEFSAAQLRFSELEARQVLSSTVSDASLQSLMNRTEGWPVALQLANLWLQHVDDPASLVEEFSGRTSNVADYLAEQVLKAQTDSVRSFLLKTSILDRFSGDLANAVCDRTDSWEILRDVGKLNSLLVPLDNEQKWFRYHQLFAEYLQDLLRRTEGDKIEQLHQAASRWLLEHNFVAEAVKHARLAGNLDEAAHMIEAYGLPRLIAIGGRQFEAETIDSFEAGYKTEFANGRVIMNTSAFYAKDDNFQFFFVDINAGGAQVIDNLDKTSMLGLEVELKALITRNWEVYAALGVLDTEIDKIDPDLPVPAAVGNKTPKTQDNSLNLGTQFSFPVGSLTGVFRFDYEHRGDKYWHTDNVAVMGPVNLAHLRASLRAESWELTLWGRNITDEFYYEDFNAVAFTGLPWDIGWPTRGASWGLEFRYQF